MPSIIYLLALVIFAMTTSEFMVAGMMNELANEFKASISSIGYLITGYAGAMVVGGPILTATLLQIRRKQALLALIVVFFLGQSLGALAWNYDSMMIARIITGIASSAAFGVSVSISATLVQPNARGKAASIVLAGLMIATVLGLPMTTIISQHVGWRSSFWAVAFLVLLSGIMIQWLLPSSSRTNQMNLKQELAGFKNPHLWSAYATSMLIIGGTFAAFSYFTPILTDVTGFTDASIPYLLALYGLATVIGNIVIGKFADQYTMPILLLGLVLLLASLVLFAAGAENQLVAVISILFIGVTGVAMNPAMITRVMKTAGSGTMVNTVHTSFITFGVAVGSSLGGIGISAGYGLTSPLWVGAGLSVLGIVSLIPYLRIGKRSRTTDEEVTL
ncbi:MFS transporter [Paenibacillus agilis]|uniref:MFS transporter n=1 Tax=Paenibacillus agilis TaxID=3020863 RepID=A0A559J0R9_9BACL|nr:MFS transporter [Paenibacillus agilis]TVX93485.1 MFS transporter [Paenibacillus agilis]